MPAILNKHNVRLIHQCAKHEARIDFNCFGAVMFALDLRPDLSWLEEDFNDFIFDKTQTELVEGNWRVGDILVMYEEWDTFYYPENPTNSDWMPIHAAVYVGQNKFFHKRGGNISEFVTLTQIKSIYNNYEFYEHRRLKI